MIYIIWLILISLGLFSFWIPILAYLLVVGVKVREKFKNHKDWVEKNYRDEERAIDANLHDFESRGLALSGMRLKQENDIRKDFECKRKKQKRQRDTELIDCFLNDKSIPDLIPQ